VICYRWRYGVPPYAENLRQPKLIIESLNIMTKATGHRRHCRDGLSIFQARLCLLVCVYIFAVTAGCAGDNRPPSLSSVGDQTAVAGGVWELSVIASDPDGDILTYRVEGTPATAEVFVVPEGLFFRWAPWQAR